jgi:hypothetical protein
MHPSSHRYCIVIGLNNASLFAMLVLLSSGGTYGRHRMEGASGSVAQPLPNLPMLASLCCCHAERRANMGGPPEDDGEKQRRRFNY